MLPRDRDPDRIRDRDRDRDRIRDRDRDRIRIRDRIRPDRDRGGPDLRVRTVVWGNR